MRRIYVSIAILALIVAGCIAAVWHLNYQTEVMIREMDHLSTVFDPENPAEYMDETLAVIESFRQRTVVFPYIIRQTTMMDIEAEIEILPALLEKGEPLDFVGALSRCQTKLETQLRMELPLPRNIF